jgi:hypothetical protein
VALLRGTAKCVKLWRVFGLGYDWKAANLVRRTKFFSLTNSLTSHAQNRLDQRISHVKAAITIGLELFGSKVNANKQANGIDGILSRKTGITKRKAPPR